MLEGSVSDTRNDDESSSPFRALRRIVVEGTGSEGGRGLERERELRTSSGVLAKMKGSE